MHLNLRCSAHPQSYRRSIIIYIKTKLKSLFQSEAWINIKGYFDKSSCVITRLHLNI